ncbi:MAG: hypothetical protein AB2392_05645 [Neobacillus sp.]
MKKILTMLCGSLIVFMMFVGSGNVAEASCGCDVSPIYGEEKNKVVSLLLSSNEFKSLRLQEINKGTIWNGINEAEVIYNNTAGLYMVAVPFYSQDGLKMMAGFVLFEGSFYLFNSPDEFDN